jgi:hypothetical protein
MLLALLALTLVALALTLPTLVGICRRGWTRAAERRSRSLDRTMPRDPGRERRAEQRARELLRSCVNDEEWAMYRDLGFIRVHGRQSGRDGSYAYLVYPHKPVVAYVPLSGRLLNEYCVEFPDIGDAISGSRLPASDDVLAKWMALTSDEDRVIRRANMHLVGRQLDPARVRRDLWRLAEWERRRGNREQVSQRHR